MKNIKVLIVDDSALMRKVISDMINSEGNMEVICTARNGKDLFNKMERYTPDVITLDVEMPIMNGIEALNEVKRKNINIPIIVLSSFSKKSSELTIDCLQKGAFDFIAKPSGAISLDINKVREDLITKINLVYEKKNVAINQMKGQLKQKTDTLENRGNFIVNNSFKSFNKKISMVVMGASTGGPKALYKVITNFPRDINVPILVVQHMPATFTKAFADRMNLNSKLKVVEAKDKQVIEKNVVYIAPGGFHMEVGVNNKINLNKEPTLWGVRPAVDKLFISASKLHKDKIVSVVLTGMGKDGSHGTEIIKNNGGITIAEHESTCTIYGMPKAAFQTGKVDMVLPLDSVCDKVTKIVTEGWR